jgi:hypothetical protein
MTHNSAKKLIKIISLSALFLVIIVYAFFRSYDLLFGVKIKNVNLADGAKMENNILNITGNAKNAVHLLLDGREVSVDQDGNWNETIALLSGYNVVSVEAKDKFGKSDEKIYKLIF